MSVSERLDKSKAPDDLDNTNECLPTKVVGARMAATGSVLTRTSGCVSEDFGGRTPVPPAMQAAQLAEDVRRSHGTHVGHGPGPKGTKKVTGESSVL